MRGTSNYIYRARRGQPLYKRGQVVLERVSKQEVTVIAREIAPSGPTWLYVVLFQGGREECVYQSELQSLEEFSEDAKSSIHKKGQGKLDL